MPERGVLAIPRTVRAGVYSTRDVRPPTEPASETTYRIALEPPHAAGAAPKIAIGICSVDIDSLSHNVRLKTSVAQDLDTAHKAFIATIWSGGPKLPHSAAVAWIDVPTERGLRTGSAALYPPGGSGILRDSTDKPVELAQVRFERPYERPPNVVCWLTGIDTCKSRNCRVRTFAKDVDGGGFTLCAATWNDTHLYGAGATWIAIPQDAPGIFVGTYSANMDRRFGRVAFPRAFHGTPKVVIGLNLLDSRQGRKLRFSAFARDVTPHDFVWEVQTWGDSHIYSAEITVIAIEPNDLEWRAAV